jgi:hypothetical protein
MPVKPTLFVVTDIETTLKHRIAFDIAWKIIDKRGREYDRGSFVVRESFKLDVPFFKEKLGHYFDDAYARLIQPATVHEVKAAFNAQIQKWQKAGHRVIAAAYNAAFDFKYLPETLQKISGDSSLRWMETRIELLDIWDYWGESVPKHYRANFTASGKFYSTSAESAYRWELCKADFVERHIAWHDVEIESEILLRALSRKQRMPVVKSPAQFIGGVYNKINRRLGVDGKSININHLHSGAPGRPSV